VAGRFVEGKLKEPRRFCAGSTRKGQLAACSSLEVFAFGRRAFGRVVRCCLTVWIGIFW
jgi:hypothetical protein